MNISNMSTLFTLKLFFQTSIKKVLICPDKFKFSMTSQQVIETIQTNLPKHISSRSLILADGG